MRTKAEDVALREMHEEAARDFCRNMTPWEFAETTVQAKQRTITWQSFGFVSRTRPDIHCLGRLSIHCPPLGGVYPFVTPDHSVVIHDGPVPVDPEAVFLPPAVQPVVAINYVDDDWPRATDIRRLERQAAAGVPYTLVFDAGRRAVTGYRLMADGDCPPMTGHRVLIPELEMEVGLFDGWMRFWFRGRLAPTAAEMADGQKYLAALEAELAALRAEVARLRGPTPG